MKEQYRFVQTEHVIKNKKHCGRIRQQLKQYPQQYSFSDAAKMNLCQLRYLVFQSSNYYNIHDVHYNTQYGKILITRSIHKFRMQIYCLLVQKIPWKGFLIFILKDDAHQHTTYNFSRQLKTKQKISTTKQKPDTETNASNVYVTSHCMAHNLFALSSRVMTI